MFTTSTKSLTASLVFLVCTFGLCGAPKKGLSLSYRRVAKLEQRACSAESASDPYFAQAISKQAVEKYGDCEGCQTALKWHVDRLAKIQEREENSLLMRVLRRRSEQAN